MDRRDDVADIVELADETRTALRDDRAQDHRALAADQRDRPDARAHAPQPCEQRQTVHRRAAADRIVNQRDIAVDIGQRRDHVGRAPVGADELDRARVAGDMLDAGQRQRPVVRENSANVEFPHAWFLKVAWPRDATRRDAAGWAVTPRAGYFYPAVIL